MSDREITSGRVTGLVDRAVGALDRELATMRAALVAEVEQLGRTVALARDEVARLRTEGEDASPIPDATDELDAIVEHTAQATETILEASEALDLVADRCPADAADEIHAHTMRIFEACSFQDITGQRIGKVVAALKVIENQVARLAGSWSAAAPETDSDRDPLLNGPQARHAAMDQDAIDKLLTI